MQLFGFEIRKKDIQKEQGSVVTPSSEDGSTIVASASAYYGTVMDIEGIVKNENDLIRRYREVAQYADTDAAIEDIVNEAIISEDGSIKLDLDKIKLSDAIKKKMQDEFQNVLYLLRFSDRGHDIFRSWYIDGRVYYHIILDEKNPKAGIAELRYVDPRKIRRIKNIEKTKNANGVEINKVVDEYYLYNDKGITEQTTQGVKLTLDSVIHAPSGLVDANTGMMLSNLHKAIKPVNQLKMIEDAVVIYRISRAPERRVFYIDVGNLPKLKAEQYVNDIMNKFRNKVVYDATTGEVRDDRKHLSMMEDFWMPRREGGKGTEITTLPGGQNLGDIQDIQYFQQKLYQALNVPLSRLQQQQGFSLGRSTEITRDEIKFSKFIARLRKRFNALFYEALRVQLIAKNIIRPEEWDDLRQSMTFVYDLDNHFTELKNNEILMQRVQMLQQMEQYVGKYYSASWVKKNVLQLTDDEIKEMESEIEEDRDQQLDDAKHQGNINTLVQPQQIDNEQQNTQQ
jgi:hypothetical protein